MIIFRYNQLNKKDMGAGNPKLKSFDNDKFEPTTYFIDLSEFIDREEDSDDDISDDLEWAFDDLVESFASELDLESHDLNTQRGNEDLSYAFRESGLILLEGNSSLIITETGAEYSHLPLAIIPSFKFEDILEEVIDENRDKEDWYEARGKDFEAAMEKRADKEWNKKMKEFHKEETIIFEKLKQWYGKGLSQRSGAWMSLKVA